MNVVEPSDRNRHHCKGSTPRKRLPLRPRVLIGVLLVLASVASLVVWADLTDAQGPGGSSGSSESEVSLPKALGEPRSLRVAPAFGAVAESLPIIVPPGRRNVQPRLTLAYSSMAGPGDSGLGWDIGIGQVTRWRGDGTPSVADEESFSYSLAGAGGHLVHTADGVYRAETESLYREFRRLGDQPDDGWEMYNGEGVLHRFGGTDASRVEDSGGRGQVWLLDLARDASGNTICYFYERVNGALYPSEIRYTGFAPTVEDACQPGGDLGANKVVFAYDESRPDRRFLYTNTVREERTRRLSLISVFAGDDLVHRYRFEYEPSPLNGQSLLQRIVLIGADDESEIVLRTLEYGSRELGWSADPISGTIPLALVSDGDETGVQIMDVNGDGRADVVGNGQGVYLGDGQGNFTSNTPWSDSLAAANIHFVQPEGDSKGTDAGVRLVDVNSDGRPDLFIAQTSRREVWINNGFGWVFDAQWTASLASLKPSAAVDPNYTDLAAPDFSAEDILDLPSFAAQLCTLADEVCEPSGPVSQFLWDGFAEATRQLIADYVKETDPAAKQLLGDALKTALVEELNTVISGDPVYEESRFEGVALSEATAILLEQDPEGEWLRRLNRMLVEDAYPTELSKRYYPAIFGPLQDGFSGEPFALVEDNGISKGVELADVNADGRLDILWAMDRSDKLFWQLEEIPIVLRAAFLNTGTGWVKSATLTDGLVDLTFVQDSLLQGYAIMDVNGDGLADIVRTMDGAQEVRLCTGKGWIEEPCDPPGQCYSDSLVNNGIVSLKEVDGERRGQGLTPIDLNDDGLVDYLRANETVTQGYRNTGSGWEPSAEMTGALASLGLAFNTADGDATGVTLADVDGDGLADVIQATADQKRLWLSASLRAGLLVRATSALGEITELTWAISTSFNNQRDGGIQGLPNPMPVVTRLARRDGRGSEYETAYDYRGGLFEDRQFRGFAWSQELLPTGFRRESSYHQEEGVAGQLRLEEGKDSQDQLHSSASSTYEKVGAWPPGCEVDVDCDVTQVRLVSSDLETFDLVGGARQSHVHNTYDQRLNIVQVWRDPELDVDGDETTTFFSWAYNDQAGIWSLPARTSVWQGNDGPVLSEFIMLYDNLPEGSAARGLASQRVSLVEIREPAEEGLYITDKFMTYDQYGNIVAIEDGEGNTTTLEYDELTSTYRTEAVDAEGHVVRSDYDPRYGALLWDMDAGGNETCQEYDDFGRLVKVTLPGDEGSPFRTRTYEYSALGNALEQWYRLRATEMPGEAGTLDTTTFFDGLGRLYRVEKEGTAGRSIVECTEYDDADNAVAMSRPFFLGDSPLWTEIERDELHRPVRVVEPDGSTVALSYFAARVDVVDRRGSQTAFYSNFDGNTTEIHQWMDGVEQVTRYRYDALGRLTATLDALGEETRITYDALGRRVRLEDPNAGTLEYGYDSEGHLIAQTGPDGQTTHFLYNRVGDLLRKEFPDGTVNEFAYDAAGNMTQIHDAAGVADMVYDARGNVIERRRTVLGRTYVTRYSYDSLNRIRSLTYPDGFVMNYEYDSAGNLALLTDGQGQTVAEGTEYSAAGQLMELGFGNGDHSSFSYDDLLRLATVRAATGAGETLQSLDYTYDPGGNILSIADSAFGASQSFEYDEIGRLTRAVGAYGEELYEYDAIGNLLRKGDLLFTVDPEHPQRVIDATNVDEAGFELAYDERGNVIEKGSQRFEYDPENHLVRVVEATGKAQGRMVEENVYDASGQRVIQRTPDDTIIFIDGIYEEGRTHASRHVRLGSLLVATVVTPRAAVGLISRVGQSPVRGLLERVVTQNPVVAVLASVIGLALVLAPSSGWTRLCDLLLNLGCAVAGHPVARRAVTLLILLAVMLTSTPPVVAAHASLEQPRSEKRYYYHSNHLGSTNVVTDERGKVVLRRDYKPYGDIFDWVGPSSGPRELLQTFNEQRYDDATGLYYFGARHYDSQLGRFLTADTEVPDPMNPKALHRYAFVEGNPVRYSDPTGHLKWWEALLGGFICGILIGLALVVTVLTFGAALPLFVGLTVGLACAGAAAFGLVAVSRGLSPTSKDFWMAVAAGAIVGAAVGAALYALPASLGYTPGLGATAGFFVGLAADVLVGAVLGGLGPIIAHLASGGGPEEILTEELGLEIATWAIKGAILGLATGVVLNAFALGGTFMTVVTGIVTALMDAEAIWELYLSAESPGEYGSLLDIFGSDTNWFRNSPARRLGIPSWAFEGTWAYSGRSEGSALFRTLPLTP